MVMSRVVLPALAVVLGVLTSCSEDAVSDDAREVSADRTHEHATGADDVVLSVDVGGGLVPVEHAFADQPELLVMGDGRVLVTSDHDPARLVPMGTVAFDEQRVQVLLDMADDAGLLDPPPDYAMKGPMITDAPTTTVVVRADGEARTHDAYALGIGDPTPARDALGDFVDQAIAYVEDAEPQPYVAERLRVRVDPVPPGVDPEVVEWPADGAYLAAVGACAVVDGDVADAIGAAGFSTYHRQGSEIYAVTAAAVLPGEADPCANDGLF